MAEIGSLIGGKYEILTEVGRGGMSVVYLAMDRNLGTQWAVKEVQKQVRGRNNEVFIQSALAEADMLKKLSHPALPRIVDIIDSPDTICIVMDFIPGESMDMVLKREGAQPEEKVLDWAKQLCEVLGYLHNRVPPIIYRDMKPNNIKYADNRLRVFDFGIAKEYKGLNAKDTVRLGTRGYAAPEAFLENAHTDARSDIYSLGVTLYHMLTGKGPHEVIVQQYPIRYWNPTLSAGLEAIISKCVDPVPANRFQSCAELMSALEDPEAWDPDNKKDLRKKFRRFLCMAGVAALLLGGGALFGRLESNEAEANYLAAMSAAAKETDHDTKISYYQDAIGYMPGAFDAYEGMVSAFKEDDSAFSVNEESELLTPLKKNIAQLQQYPEEYVELCFDIGKLYWFYYDYGSAGNNEITRVKSAIPWFSDVVEYCDNNEIEYNHYSMAQIFRDIGIFNRDYSMNIQEASGSGTYIEYWDNLGQLKTYLESHPDEEELVAWEGYRVIVFSIENYMTKFRSDGVSEGDMRTICNQLGNDINSLEATDEKTQEIRDYIVGRLTPDTGDIWVKLGLTY